jgi:hypothetical protein
MNKKIREIKEINLLIFKAGTARDGVKYFSPQPPQYKINLGIVPTRSTELKMQIELCKN